MVEGQGYRLEQKI